MYAAYNNNCAMVQFLIDNGVNPDIETINGETPLQFAAFNGFENISRMLIEKGANPNGSHSRLSVKPLYWAAKGGDIRIAELLLKNGADDGI